MTTKAMAMWRERMRGGDPEQAAADWDRSVEEENSTPFCPICGDERDERVAYCSAACAADDEETTLDPEGFAGDLRVKCGSCGARGAKVLGAKRVARYCDAACAALASDLDCTTRTPTAEELRTALGRKARAEVDSAAKRLAAEMRSGDFLVRALGFGSVR